MKFINQASNLSKPFLCLPELNNNEETVFKNPEEVKIYEYYAVSDGRKKIYTLTDALSGYGEQNIQNPVDVSFYNLFINGVLQPSVTYKIENKELILTTDDVPIKGSPIILQMILI